MNGPLWILIVEVNFFGDWRGGWSSGSRWVTGRGRGEGEWLLFGDGITTGEEGLGLGLSCFRRREVCELRCFRFCAGGLLLLLFFFFWGGKERLSHYCNLSRGAMCKTALSISNR